MWGSKRAILEAKPDIPWPMRLITWLAPALVLATLLGGLFWFIRDHAAFHVVAVRVYGAERVPRADLIQLAQITGGMSLFRIEVERVRMRVMQHPWIREALVRRVYPNELEIIVYERRPTAILESGSGYLVDGEGYVLSHAAPVEAASLPRLVARLSHTPSLGERLTDPAIQAGLRLLDQAHDSPFFRDSVITHIDIIDAERFLVQTRRGRLIMGASLVGIGKKLELFPAIDEALRNRARRAEYVDVSVENQIIVKTTARTTQAAGRLQRRGGDSGQVR
ncbi:MAG: FtsQ-type POTRA domain-containing protein [Candidatus Tectomicrobia bacterium]|nr:FtsQ-type POTRA domain-containing protein [Candidatus Tectomicrobia bacterium]